MKLNQVLLEDILDKRKFNKQLIIYKKKRKKKSRDDLVNLQECFHKLLIKYLF